MVLSLGATVSGLGLAVGGLGARPVVGLVCVAIVLVPAHLLVKADQFLADREIVPDVLTNLLLDFLVVRHARSMQV